MKGGGCTVHPPPSPDGKISSAGLIFPSWWNVRQKLAIATLCTLWWETSEQYKPWWLGIESPPQSNELTRGPPELALPFVGGSSHRRKSFACPKFVMVWQHRSAIPVGRRGVISLFKWFLPAVATCSGRGGGSTPCGFHQTIQYCILKIFHQLSCTENMCSKIHPGKDFFAHRDTYKETGDAARLPAKIVRWGKKYFVLGRRKQPRQDKNLLYLQRQAQQTNQGRISFICTPWVPICRSFNSQQGSPLSSLSDCTQSGRNQLNFTTAIYIFLIYGATQLTPCKSKTTFIVILCLSI